MSCIILLLVLFIIKSLSAPTLVYVGRPTCPYCKDFNPTWRHLVMSSVYRWYTTEHHNTDTPSGQAFREKVGVTTVPCILRRDRFGVYLKYTGPREYAPLKYWAVHGHMPDEECSC